MSAPDLPGSPPPERAPAEGNAPGAPDEGLGHAPTRSIAVTATITVVCVALMGLAYLWGGKKLGGGVLWRMGAGSAETFESHELYRLFSAAFLHADGVHLFVNMLALWSFGPFLEGLLGGKRYILLYAASALGGSLASSLLGTQGYSVGASGAIWGLMTAGIGIAYWPRGLLWPHVTEQLRRRAMYPVAINLLYSLRPGIDWRAHLGGGVVGFLACAFVLNRGLVPLAERRTADEVEAEGKTATGIAAATAALLMGVSILLAIMLGRPWENLAPPVYVRTAIGDTGLSAKLPKTVADKVEVEQLSPDVRLFSYGRSRVAPVIVHVFISDMPLETMPEEKDELLNSVLADADKDLPKKYIPEGKAKRMMVGDHDAVFTQFRIDNLLIGKYTLFLGQKNIIVQVYHVEEGAPGWSDVEARVTESIQLD